MFLFFRFTSPHTDWFLVLPTSLLERSNRDALKMTTKGEIFLQNKITGILCFSFSQLLFLCCHILGPTNTRSMESCNGVNRFSTDSQGIISLDHGMLQYYLRFRLPSHECSSTYWWQRQYLAWWLFWICVQIAELTSRPHKSWTEEFWKPMRIQRIRFGRNLWKNWVCAVVVYDHKKHHAFSDIQDIQKILKRNWKPCTRDTHHTRPWKVWYEISSAASSRRRNPIIHLENTTSRKKT